MSILPLSLYSTEAVRTLEREVQRRLGTPPAILMQRAGEGAWAVIRQRWPGARKILVVCGCGNNGGDGYVLASCALKVGFDVSVVEVMAGRPSCAQAQSACAAYVSAGGRMIDAAQVCWHEQDVIVDAILGIGLNRPLDRALVGVIEAINQGGRPVLALDSPTGVDAQTGAIAQVAVRAAVTIQFLLPHVGLYTGPACDAVGVCICDGLSLPVEMLSLVTPVAEAWSAPVIAQRALPPRRRTSHKGDYGHVLCLGGNHGYGGAIILAALAAMRAGAGAVRLTSRSDLVAGAALALAPELMPLAVDRRDDSVQACERASVLALGPGLGQDAWAHVLWQVAMDAGRPLVIDADALDFLAAEPQPTAGAILTPHPGEAARLLGCSSADVQADRLACAQLLAHQFAAVVVLKGAGTIVAAPGQRARLIDAGNPGMAVAGMGDVLTGIIAGLSAQGMLPFEAASLGALIHASGGDEVVAQQGERGVSPLDVIAAMRRLVNSVRSPCASGT